MILGQFDIPQNHVVLPIKNVIDYKFALFILLLLS